MSEVGANSVVPDHRSEGVGDRASSYVVGAAGTGAVCDPAPNQYQAFLDQVPAGWDIQRLGEIARIVGGGTPSRDCKAFWNGDIPWVTPGEVSKEESKHLASTTERITFAGLAGSGANLLPIGALMVTTRATLGARAIASVPMATNQGFKSLVFPSLGDAVFYFYLAPKFKSELARRASGTTFLEISSREFAQIEVPCPPRQEKYEIARVLDTLDTTIRQTEAIIAKLKHVKQGLLHDLLTRGIDANGELRPSQSQAPHLYKESLLGWIPKEWDAVPVSELAVNLDGMRVPIKESERRFGIYPYYGASGIIDWVDAYILDGDFVLLGEDGENVVSRNLPLAFRVTGKIWVNNHAHILEPKQGVDIRFLAEVLEAKDYGPWVSGSAQPKLTQDAMTRIRFQRPLGYEQTAIADRLGALSCRITTEQRELEKLRTAKSGLMDDLLTGRVRVTPLLQAATTP